MTNTISGILKLTNSPKGAGVLYNPSHASHASHPSDLSQSVFVPAKLIEQFHLPEGACLTGAVQRGKRGLLLTMVELVCGLPPEQFQRRKPLNELIAIHPSERFKLAASGQSSMRLLDLVAPIGKGTRGLIVAPPKAGKTMLLEQMAKAIQVSEPETRLIVLLIDERPEEVTHFRRSMPGAEVFASSSDQSLREHVELSKLMLAHIRLELECGRDVVILMDSLTRLVRAFNLKGSSGGGNRSLSGGVEASAFQIPRRFFGLARHIEHGGSITMIATVLVDTGSRMDQVIFEEFKGTGNCEIVLERSLAEAYIFPAINLLASGTRRMDRLYDENSYQQLLKLRRELATLPPKEAILLLLDLLAKSPTNEELLASL